MFTDVSDSLENKSINCLRFSNNEQEVVTLSQTSGYEVKFTGDEIDVSPSWENPKNDHKILFALFI